MTRIGTRRLPKGQNSNNSVRVTNDFIKAVEVDEPWTLTRRTDGVVAKERLRANFGSK